MRKYVVPLLAANVMALLTIGASYIAYSRILSADEFGVYSTALAIGTFAVLILDSGIKTVIIKRKEGFSADEAGTLLTVLAALAILLIALTIAAGFFVPRYAHWKSGSPLIIAAFACVYLATYPWISISTAILERSLSYSKLAWIEAVGTAVERGSPAILLFLTHVGLMAFVYGLLAGRILRVATLQILAPVKPVLSRRRRHSIGKLFGEGLWFQIAGGASSVRDNLHVLLVGPLCGTSWVGYYAWALQLCIIASQLFVQISARISLPLTAQAAGGPARWQLIMRQTRALAATSGPVLAALVIAAPVANRWLFHDKWTAALPLVALICLRMLPSVASTCLGPFLLIERGTRQYATAMWLWTGAEILAALISIAVFGNLGLAYSYAIVVWVGIALLTMNSGNAGPTLFLDVVKAILARPAVWVALPFGVVGFILRGNSIFLTHWSLPVTCIGTLGIAAIMADRELRAVLRPLKPVSRP